MLAARSGALREFPDTVAPSQGGLAMARPALRAASPRCLSYISTAVTAATDCALARRIASSEHSSGSGNIAAESRTVSLTGIWASRFDSDRRLPVSDRVFENLAVRCRAHPAARLARSDGRAGRPGDLGALPERPAGRGRADQPGTGGRSRAGRERPRRVALRRLRTYGHLTVASTGEELKGAAVARLNAADINELHARVCKALADPKRLLILNALRDGPRAPSASQPSS